MDDQIAILTTFLTALLTGGFIILFIESNQITNRVIERFYTLMNPFAHSLSNYIKVVSDLSIAYTFPVETKDSYISKLKDNIESITKLGFKMVRNGKEFTATQFTAKELDLLCERINNIWYYADKNWDDFDNIKFDQSFISDYTKDALKEIGPKYQDYKFSNQLLPTLSGEFYVDFYQPIQDLLSHYERWDKKTKEFKLLACITLSLTILTMIFLLLLRDYIHINILNTLCVICLLLLGLELYKLVQLEKMGKQLMR